MFKYKTQEGQLIIARDARGVVAALRAESHSPGGSARDFMCECAARVSAQLGKEVDGSSAAHLVAGLLAAGLLREVSDDEA
jgi:hypothetical protein